MAHALQLDRSLLFHQRTHSLISCQVLSKELKDAREARVEAEKLTQEVTDQTRRELDDYEEALKRERERCEAQGCLLKEAEEERDALREEAGRLERRVAETKATVSILRRQHEGFQREMKAVGEGRAERARRMQVRQLKRERDGFNPIIQIPFVSFSSLSNTLHFISLYSFVVNLNPQYLFHPHDVITHWIPALAG